MVARCIGASRADIGFAEIAAARAMADLLHRLRHHGSEFFTAATLALQQVVGHALRGFLPNAR